RRSGSLSPRPRRLRTPRQRAPGRTRAQPASQKSSSRAFPFSPRRTSPASQVVPPARRDSLSPRLAPIRVMPSSASPPAPFSPLPREWFEGAFAEPTPAQAGAWSAIASGQHALVIAPTGSGKTLAAFLWAIDRLAAEPPPNPKERLRVLYVSPLKA